MRSLWAINKISTQEHIQFIIRVWAGYESLKAMQMSVFAHVEHIQRYARAKSRSTKQCITTLCLWGFYIKKRNNVAHDLPAAPDPPLPKAWSDNKISISTFSKSLWMGSLKRLKPPHCTLHKLADRWLGADFSYRSPTLASQWEIHHRGRLLNRKRANHFHKRWQLSGKWAENGC